MRTHLSTLILLLSGAGMFLHAQSDHVLHYDKPARFFEESLVLGNGRAGASIYGGTGTDTIFLNEATLWAGEPVDPNMNPEAHSYIPAIREALKREDYALADSLQLKVQGKFSHSYAPLGTLMLDMLHGQEIINYHRELDISRAVSRVEYQNAGCTYEREYFVSHPDSLLIIRLTASQKGKLNFDVRFESLLCYTLSTDNNLLQASGYAPWHAEPSYLGDIENAIRFDPERGTRFSSLVQISKSDGQVVSKENSIGVRGGSEAILLISLSTSFNGFDRNPVSEGRDHKKLAMDQLQNASKLSYNNLLDRHLKDYQNLFGRVSLNLGESSIPELSTDLRLKRYAEGKQDPDLEVLYFQFGRYLLISSSRTPGVPANLQGIWNPYLRPPWSSNYTMNINVEENYWLAENTNLSELHMPLMQFIENLAKGGEITAQTFYGAKGWTACHNSDIWAMSNPVGDFGQGNPVWANWNMGGAWLSTHLWEHYIFTKDKNFLEKQAWPLMKGAATFCLDWLVEGPKGDLITSPSTSPENIYLTPEGYHGATLYGGTADLAMIRELFILCIRATEELEQDQEFRSELETALDKLHPYKIGKKGNLQEWYYDWEDAEPKHRHQSHLYGLYPGQHINPMETPELAQACRTTLEIKGDESTGWSKGWRINLWARLQDGNRAYKMYRELLRYVNPDGLKTSYSGGGGTYPNLLDAHPPFQIDGNFGGAAAVAEMLLQSSAEEIYLLPALPDAWPKGSYTGLRARGGFELDLKWEESAPLELNISSEKGGNTTLKHGSWSMDISLDPGQSRTINWQ